MTIEDEILRPKCLKIDFLPNEKFRMFWQFFILYNISLLLLFSTFSLCSVYERLLFPPECYSQSQELIIKKKNSRGGCKRNLQYKGERFWFRLKRWGYFERKNSWKAEGQVRKVATASRRAVEPECFNFTWQKVYEGAPKRLLIANANGQLYSRER